MWIALAAAVLGCTASHSPAEHLQDPPAPESGVSELVPGTRVRLDPPAGHAPGSGFFGYQWPQSAASLLVLELPGGFAETVQALDSERLEQQGVELLEAADVEIDGREARLVLGAQEAHGARYRKWIALFGDDERSVMLSAIFPEELRGDLPDRLKAALLSASWHPELEIDPFATVPWTGDRPEGLLFAGNVSTAFLFTEDGEVDQEDHPGAAMMIVAPSMGVVDVGDLRGFAEQRLRRLPLLEDFAVESSVAFDAGGLRGWELVATARAQRGSVVRLVHQVVLVDEGEYFLFVGQSAVRERDTWLPRFRACAASWKPEPAPPAERD